MCSIRSITRDDQTAIYKLLVDAFPTDGEARLVEQLRNAGKLVVELVADDDGIVGHVAFSPVSIGADGSAPSSAVGVGLAPLCVAPARERQGIGGRLVAAGLDACRELGVGYVVVLGHPEYYQRFGFERASGRKLANEYGVDEPFMVLELRSGSIPPAGGLVRFASEFAGLEE